MSPICWLQEYQKDFPDIPIGYSGHESGVSITVAAVALGAKVVERHITLDKTWKGSDHEASLEPAELAELVRSIRLVERALGSGIKRMLPCEKPCHDKVRTPFSKKKLIKNTQLYCLASFSSKCPTFSFNNVALFAVPSAG